MIARITSRSSSRVRRMQLMAPILTLRPATAFQGVRGASTEIRTGGLSCNWISTTASPWSPAPRRASGWPLETLLRRGAWSPSRHPSPEIDGRGELVHVTADLMDRTTSGGGGASRRPVRRARHPRQQRAAAPPKLPRFGSSSRRHRLARDVRVQPVLGRAASGRRCRSWSSGAVARSSTSRRSTAASRRL